MAEETTDKKLKDKQDVAGLFLLICFLVFTVTYGNYDVMDWVLSRYTSWDFYYIVFFLMLFATNVCASFVKGSLILEWCIKICFSLSGCYLYAELFGTPTDWKTIDCFGIFIAAIIPFINYIFTNLITCKNYL